MTETTERSPETRRAVEVAEWRAVRELQKARDAAQWTLVAAQDSHARVEDLADRAEEVIRERNREEVREWARGVLENPGTRLLALATTGLHDPIDVVEVVVLDRFGGALLSESVRPDGYVAKEKIGDGEETVEVRRDPVEISPGASAMHHHTAESLAGAPTFADLYPRLREALEGKRAVVYNAEYAGRVLEQTFARYGLEPIVALRACAMEAYARVEGEWSVETRSYYPVKLPHADGTPLGNACALHALLEELAGVHERGPGEASGGGRREDIDIDESSFEDIPFMHRQRKRPVF